MTVRTEDSPRFSPMRDPEIAQVCAIENGAYEFPWTEGNFRDSLSAGYSAWVCHVDDEIVGYAVLMIAIGEAHLLNLTIARLWQGRGLGVALLRFLIGLARERHCERILLEVRQSNTLACHLYQANDFVQIGVRKAYYPATLGREDAIVFERRIAGESEVP
jgi:ribosomal-protein-alanine N-acetyltransferase